MKKFALILFLPMLLAGCGDQSDLSPAPDALVPVVITEKVRGDSDDPAIWINYSDPESSLVVGTDKVRPNGALYVFSLDGAIQKIVDGINGPNNVDIRQGVFLDGLMVDVAVTAERNTGVLRVFSLPDMMPLDNGGIPILAEQPDVQAMGVSLYVRSDDGALFVLISGRGGDSGEYIWQYRLTGNGSGAFVAHLERRFGLFSGSGEIEAVAVDDELGYVYYSDENYAVRKYHADPENGDDELAAFGLNDELLADGGTPFKSDREGIAIYPSGPGAGYILVSDQQGLRVHVYPREGMGADPHDHPQLSVVPVSALLTDGLDVTNQVLLPDFPQGMLVMMSDDRSFHFYTWEEVQDVINLTP